MRISHETIYDAFYLQAKGRLKDLGLDLPTGRSKRKKRQTRTTTPARQRCVGEMVLIDDRPDEVFECILSSITWDQGSEIAGHKACTIATDIPIYFCHPGSLWERGSSENTNGRRRRNLPKNSDLTIYSAEDLEMIANNHNHKPRKALNWRIPAEVVPDALKQTGSITPK